MFIPRKTVVGNSVHLWLGPLIHRQRAHEQPTERARARRHRTEAHSVDGSVCDARGVIFGAHVIIYTRDAEADRAFLRDVLGFEGVDAGHGWLTFALPPAEIAAHPSDTGGRHELYLMCDDIHATVRELRGKGVEVVREVSDEGWGLLTGVGLPGGGERGLSEPRH